MYCGLWSNNRKLLLKMKCLLEFSMEVEPIIYIDFEISTANSFFFLLPSQPHFFRLYLPFFYDCIRGCTWVKYSCPLVVWNGCIT